MARINRSNSGSGPRTHEGAPAVVPRSSLAALRRSVCACLLWEDQFYEDGQAIADRIIEQARACNPQDVANLAIEAREQMGLRHAPLLLTLSLFGRDRPFIGARATVARVIRRADELAEILAIYWKDGRKKLPRGLLRGIADAFSKFDEYQLAKYDRSNAVKLRDALRLARPKPEDEEQAALWGRLRRGELRTPDTWETQLSGGADKKETFERLISEGKLGYLALLRNLRKMTEVNVDHKLVSDAILARKGARGVFPFRYVAAERAAPGFSVPLDTALQAQIDEEVKLPGLTVVLVDVSGSMNSRLSEKSDMTRMDAAAALASVIPAESLRVFSFSYEAVEVPARRGLAGVDAVVQSQYHGGTNLGAALRTVAQAVPRCDRLIVVTDEQSHDSVGGGHAPAGRNYMINVASYRNGVGFGEWVRVDGFSEGIIRFIRENEGVAEKAAPVAEEPVARDLADA
jgi:60 kDa SS-A/Ro ribonucleoprotein